MIISGIDISTYSFISAMIIFSLSVIIVLIFAKKTSFIAAYGIHFILFSIVLSIIRLLIPLDIYWAKIIDLDYILHPLEKILLFFHTDLEEMKPIFLILWGSGSLLFFLYVSWTFVMDIYTLKKLKKIKPEKTLSFIEESEFDKIDIVISPQISVPKVWGICKPHIYLPDLELDESEWRLIINHEIQHIRNHDTLIKMIILVITMIFWWNPIMLLLWKKKDHFLEMRCDTMLLKSASKNEKVSYLNMIIKVLRQTNDHRGELVSSALIHTSAYQLTKQRFESILMDVKRKRGKRFSFYLIIFLMFLSSYFIILQPRYLPEEDEIYESSTYDFILYTKDNKYLFFKDGKLYEELTKEDIKDDKYKDMEIISEE